MGLYKRLARVGAGLSDFAVNKIGKTTGHILNAGMKGVPFTVETLAGGANTAINAGIKTTDSIKSGRAAKKAERFLGKVNKTFWTDESSYSAIGKNTDFSKKFLFGDDINRRIKSVGDKTADFISKTDLIKKNEDSLINYSITGKGFLAAAGVSLVAGTPKAIKQHFDDRQGTNMSSQSVTSAPRIPAYAQNGGASGDLVFALNNLRNGGMM